MSTQHLIAIETYCQHEELDPTFVQALFERGLVEMVLVHERPHIDPAHLARLEQLVRLHDDLQINLEGIEAISHMLERMEQLQGDVRTLRERLRLYEGDES